MRRGEAMLDRLEPGIKSCNNLEELINCFFDIFGGET